MRRRSLSVAAAITSAALLAAGCGSNSSSSTQASSSSTPVALDRADYNPQPYDNLKDGGTYTTAGSFDGDDSQGLPWNVNSSLTSSRLWNWYNPVAITFSTSGEVQVNPDYYVSTKDEMVNGKQTVTITLNPKAVYNDGTPIDWHSIEQTWIVGSGKLKGAQVGATTGYDQIESVKQGTDAHQAVVTFAKPYTGWPSLFSNFINPKAATVANFNTAYANKVEPQWGAGPFTVESYDSNSKKLVFKRNPKWWGKTGKLEKRIFLDFANSQAATNAFKNGQIDQTSAISAETRKQVSGVAGTEIRQGGSPFQYYLFVNGKSSLLTDVNVRHAVLAAVDRKQIDQIEFQGLGYSEPLPGSSLYYSWQKGYSDNLSKVLVSSSDEAAKILDADGWKPGSDGIRTKDGKRLTIGYTLFGDDPTDKALAASLTAAEKKAGVEIKVQSVNDTEWASTINGGKFDLVLSGNRSMDPYGNFLLNTFYGSTTSSNITRIGTPEIDKEIAEVNGMSDPTAQVQKANEVETKALALYGVLPLFSGPSTYAVKKDLANVGATLLYSPLPETVGYTK